MSARTLLAQATVPMLFCLEGQVHQVSDGWKSAFGVECECPYSLEVCERLIGLNASELSQAVSNTQLNQLELMLQIDDETRHYIVYLERLQDSTEGNGCWLIFIDNSVNHRAELALGQIVASVSAARGNDFFNRLTSTLCSTLSTDVAMIGVLEDGTTPSVRTLSCFMDGEITENITYTLPGTPCSHVMGQEPCLYSSRVQRLFPDDQFLVDYQIEGYLGVPLEDSYGKPLGLIVLLSRQQLTVTEHLFSMLSFVARRVESEVERQMAEDRLVVSNLGLNAAERLASMGSWVVDIARQTVLLSDEMSKLYQLEEFNGEVPRNMTMARVHPEDRERVRAQIASGEVSGEPYTFDHRILRPDGQVRWIRSACEPVRVDGELIKILGVSQDVTALTHSQRQAFESEQRQRRLISACPYGITQLDRELRFVYVNEVAEEIYGYQRNQLLGRSLRDVCPPEQWPQTHKLFTDLLEQRPHVERYHRTGLRPDGEIRQLDITLNYILDEKGETQGFIGFLTDETDKVAAELRLSQLSTIVEQSPSSILITDMDGIIEYINPAFEATSGYSLEEVTGQTPRILRSGKTDMSTYEQMWQTITRGDPWRGEFLNKRKDGSLFWELASVAPIRSAEGEITHFVSINEDITRLKKQEAQLAYQANYDPVTHLPNRVLAMDRINRAIVSAERNRYQIAVMFVDLDQFKRINDTFGHSCGDELLVRAAERLQQTVRNSDTVARFGGDEFVILLDELTDNLAVEKVAEKVLRAFAAPVSIDEHQLTVTASIGVATYPQDGTDPETLLSHADAAMYTAKEQGRNCFHFFTPEMNDIAQSRLRLESYLQQALVRQEMTVYYQPVIAFSSGQVVGAEALLRWYCPELGMVPPDQFIPLAEDLGLIDELGEWVIDQVLSQYDQWRELLEPGFRCAINVSPKQFQRGKLASYLLERLERYGVPGKAIELEVTEGLLMQNWPTVDSQIEALADAGVSLSIDDFGTGYSSISYLRKYPFTTLKIDRSFVNDLLDDKDDETLVRSVIAMAQGMGLAIIAEGVETFDQYHLLEDAQCSMMQGYLFSRPVPADDFQQLLVSHRQMSDLLVFEESMG